MFFGPDLRMVVFHLTIGVGRDRGRSLRRHTHAWQGSITHETYRAGTPLQGIPPLYFMAQRYDAVRHAVGTLRRSSLPQVRARSMKLE